MSYTNSIFTLTFFVFGTLLTSSCEKEMESLRPFPVLQIQPITENDADGVTVRVDIIRPYGGDSNVEYGIIYSYSGPGGTQFHRKATVDDGASYFTYRIDDKLIEGQRYNVKAYTRVGSRRVLSDEVSFSAKGTVNRGWEAMLRGYPMNDLVYLMPLSNNEQVVFLASNRRVFQLDYQTNEFGQLPDLFPAGFQNINTLDPLRGQSDRLAFHHTRRYYEYEGTEWIAHPGLPDSLRDYGVYTAFEKNGQWYSFSGEAFDVFDPVQGSWARTELEAPRPFLTGVFSPAYDLAFFTNNIFSGSEIWSFTDSLGYFDSKNKSNWGGDLLMEPYQDRLIVGPLRESIRRISGEKWTVFSYNPANNETETLNEFYLPGVDKRPSFWVQANGLYVAYIGEKNRQLSIFRYDLSDL